MLLKINEVEQLNPIEQYKAIWILSWIALDPITGAFLHKGRKLSAGRIYQLVLPNRSPKNRISLISLDFKNITRARATIKANSDCEAIRQANRLLERILKDGNC